MLPDTVSEQSERALRFAAEVSTFRHVFPRIGSRGRWTLFACPVTLMNARYQLCLPVRQTIGWEEQVQSLVEDLHRSGGMPHSAGFCG